MRLGRKDVVGVDLAAGLPDELRGHKGEALFFKLFVFDAMRFLGCCLLCTALGLCVGLDAICDVKRGGDRS